jgi:hypothetical protein
VTFLTISHISKLTFLSATFRISDFVLLRALTFLAFICLAGGLLSVLCEYRGACTSARDASPPMFSAIAGERGAK